jgi:hypothetical protein
MAVQGIPPKFTLLVGRPQPQEGANPTLEPSNGLD